MTIRRGNHPHVDARLHRVGADALDFAGLEKSKQQSLHPRARLADLVHEHGTAVSQLQRA